MSLSISGPLIAPRMACLRLGAEVSFLCYVHLQVAPYYPQVFDQLSYMSATTQLLDNFSRRGLAALIQPFLSPMPTGITYPLQGALAQLVLGPSRAALLTVNLIYFLAVQLCLFLTVRRALGAPQPAWVALALFIGCVGIFKTAGGIADYRIDFAAMCLFGIWVCTLSWTREFTGKSAFSPVVAAARSCSAITAAGVGPIYLVLLCYLAF